MIPQLKRLGLSSGEAKVYLAALEMGQASVQRIAQKARLKRTSCYGLIDSLREKNLLKLTRVGKRNLYYVDDPHAFLDIFAEQSKAAELLLPSLRALMGIADKKPQVLFFEGSEGMKNLYKETLASPAGSKIYGWISASALHMEGKWFDDVYRPARIKKKNYTHAIMPDDEATRAYRNRDVEGFHQTRVESRERLLVASDILIFGDRHVALLSWEEMVGIVIESKKIHDTLRSIFEIHWGSLAGSQGPSKA